ncbi:hypothetical protein, partial [Colwellia echini]|uniref:hypothetical protein n=1 Tax=Colwellia echini TaxID=1982103 RepID=UPI0014793166
ASNIEEYIASGVDSTFEVSTGDNAWNITDNGDGTVAGVSFTNFANLQGGSGDDDFTLVTRGQIIGTIDGGTGAETNGDTLTISAASQTVNITDASNIEEY